MEVVPPARSTLVQDLKSIFAVTLATLDSTLINQSRAFKGPAALVDCGISPDHETFRSKLRSMAEQSLAYAVSVEDLCWFGCDEDRIKKIKERIVSGDYGELADFIHQLNTFLAKTQEAYRGVKAIMEDLLSIAQEAAQTCQKEREEGKLSATRAVGGAAATEATGVAGGVAASVVAGIFTFGVGTIVGLSLTAAGAAAAGAGIATGTCITRHIIASRSLELEGMFLQLTQSCDDIMQSVSCMNDSICCLKIQVELLTSVTDNIRQARASPDLHSSLITALDHLCQTFDEFDHQHFSALQKELEKGLVDIVPKLNS